MTDQALLAVTGQFFSGISFQEPDDDMQKFRKKVETTFKGTGLKWCFFLMLVVRVSLVVKTTVSNMHNVGETKDARRVRASFCVELQNTTQQQLCRKDISDLISKYNAPDVGQEFLRLSKFIARGEMIVLCMNALVLFMMILQAACSEKERARSLMGAKVAANRIAGLSALKFLAYINPSVVMLYWNALWLPGLHAGTQVKWGFSNLEDKQNMQRLFRALSSVMFVCGVGASLLLAVRTLQAKVMQYGYLMYLQPYELGLWELVDLLSMLNIFASVYNIGEIKMLRTGVVGFGGDNARMENEEYESQRSFLELVVDIVLKSEKFHPLSKVIIALQFDADDLQKIMLEDKWKERHDSDATESVRKGMLRWPCLPIFMILFMVIFAWHGYVQTNSMKSVF